MAVTLALSCLSLSAAWILWNIYLIAKNYVIAQRIGLPILLCPVDPLNPLWVLARPAIDPTLRRLPFGLGDFARYSYIGWPWECRYQFHARYGPAFTIVSPGGCEVVVGDMVAAANILNRWKDFIKNPTVMEGFNIFGPNLLTAEGETWQRHRRITTPPFNERNSSLVWIESTSQATELLKLWTSPGATAATGNIKADTSTVALNVLSGAGFGKSVPFDSKYRKPDRDHELSFLDAIHTVSDNVLAAAVLNSIKNIPPWLLPKALSRVQTSIRETKSYLTRMVVDERQAYAKGISGEAGQNLMSNLVKLAEQAKLSQGQDEKLPSNRTPGLSDDEIFGNLFLYNIAGHETTANALSYSIPLLVVYPEMQDWIIEEIQSVVESGKQGGAVKVMPSYEDTFPQLKRCLAVMHETLRLYAPLNGIPRWTGDSSQPLTIGEKTILVPPKTTVIVNNGATQMNPAIWGDDVDSWRPTRWISSTGASGREEFLSGPTKDGFLAWSSGPRVCPGLKFSQVEFVAVMAGLFLNHRVEPVLEHGESMDDARRRIAGLVQDSHMLTTVQIRHPERVKVRWVPIGGK